MRLVVSELTQCEKEQIREVVRAEAAVHLDGHAQQLPTHREQVIQLHLRFVIANLPVVIPEVAGTSCFHVGVELAAEKDAEWLAQDHRVREDLGDQPIDSGRHAASQSAQVLRRLRRDGLAVASEACPKTAGTSVLELAEEAEQRADGWLGDSEPRAAQQGDHAAEPVGAQPTARRLTRRVRLAGDDARQRLEQHGAHVEARV
mmetsp:Transcript_5120/g.14964  ORF Transcript_5120/g.14964 Transcript_5120/m.14964 type:complete len:203 (+) Transcript_5120:747-1355(+)